MRDGEGWIRDQSPRTRRLSMNAVDSDFSFRSVNWDSESSPTPTSRNRGRRFSQINPTSDSMGVFNSAIAPPTGTTSASGRPTIGPLKSPNARRRNEGATSKVQESKPQCASPRKSPDIGTRASEQSSPLQTISNARSSSRFGDVMARRKSKPSFAARLRGRL